MVKNAHEAFAKENYYRNIILKSGEKSYIFNFLKVK